MPTRDTSIPNFFILCTVESQHIAMCLLVRLLVTDMYRISFDPTSIQYIRPCTAAEVPPGRESHLRSYSHACDGEHDSGMDLAEVVGLLYTFLPGYFHLKDSLVIMVTRCVCILPSPRVGLLFASWPPV